MTERAALIVNPTSGGGRGWRVLGEAAPLLRKAGVVPEVVMCTNGDEPGELARQAAADGHELVVAVGGDGQAAAVAAGLIGTATVSVDPASLSVVVGPGYEGRSRAVLSSPD